MARFNDKSKLIQLLAETPVVSFVCKKIGLDRTTYYRWYKDDRSFREKVDRIMTIGRMNINDMAEASIIQKIHNGNMRANIFWLQHNHPIYKPVKTTYVDPISPHAHELAPGEICRSCGYREPEVEEYKGIKKHKRSLTNEELSKELYKRVKTISTRKQSETELRKIIDDFVQENNVKFQITYVDASKRDDGEESKNS